MWGPFAALVVLLVLSAVQCPAQLRLNWSAGIGGSNGVVQVCSHARVDRSGNFYLALRTYDATNGHNSLLRKFNASGSNEWSLSLSPLATFYDLIADLQIADDGPLFVSALDDDGYFLAAISPEGQVLWRTNALGQINSIALAPDGLVVAMYYTTNGSEPSVPMLQKFSPAGELIASNRLENATAGAAIRSLTVAPSGHVYLEALPQCTECPESSRRVYVRCSPELQVLWAQADPDPVTWNDSIRPPALRVGTNGDLIIGKTDYPGPTIIAYSTTGARLWSVKYPALAKAYGWATLTLNKAGTIVCATDEGVLLCADSAGQYQWSSYTPIASSSTITMSTDGTNFYRAHSTFDFYVPETFAITEIDPSGSQLWSFVDTNLTPATYDTVPCLWTTGNEVRVVLNVDWFVPTGTHLASYTQTNVTRGPVITSAPSLQLVTNGGDLRLSVTAVGSGPLSYRWFHNGYSAIGSNSAMLVLTNMGSYLAGGPYSVEVTDANGTTRSPDTFVAVITPPTDQETVLNGTAVFRVSIVGTAIPEKQWYFGNTAISGATETTLLLSNVQPSAAGSYSFHWRDGLGAGHSSTARLAVSTSASLEWIRSFPEWTTGGMALDQAGNLCIGAAGSGFRGYVLSPDGDVIQTIDYHPGIEAGAVGVSMDAAGRIFMNGSSGVSGGGGYNWTLITVAFNPSFESLLWSREVVSSSYGAAPTGIAAGENGWCFQSSRSKPYRTSSGWYAGVAAIQDTNGFWLPVISGASTEDIVEDMKSGPSGQVFTLCRSWQGWSRSVATIGRFATNGSAVWRLTIPETNRWYRAIAVTPDAHLLAVAHSGSGWWVEKYATNGTLAWSREFGVHGVAAEAHADTNGTLTITGKGATAAVDRDGRLLWISGASGERLAPDADGNRYLAFVAETGWDIIVTALDAGGARRWNTTWPGGGTENRIRGFLTGPGGAVYVAINAGSSEFRVAKLSSAMTSPAMPGTWPTIVQASPGGIVLSGPDAPVQYQWTYDGSDLAGATNRHLDWTTWNQTGAGSWSLKMISAGQIVESPQIWITPRVTLSALGGSPIYHGFSFTADPGLRYELLRSTNLQSWQAITALQRTGLVNYLDFSATNLPQAIYRLRLER